jgi:hypothetical protein
MHSSLEGPSGSCTHSPLQRQLAKNQEDSLQAVQVVVVFDKKMLDTQSV